MAAKDSAAVQAIKGLINDNKAIIGKNEVLKALKAKTTTKVYLANNAPENLKGDIDYYSKLANIEVETIDLDNEELGVICKKNFFIAVIAQKQ